MPGWPIMLGFGCVFQTSSDFGLSVIVRWAPRVHDHVGGFDAVEDQRAALALACAWSIAQAAVPVMTHGPRVTACPSPFLPTIKL